MQVVKIEGFKVFFSDGDVIRKDVNSLWIYQSFLAQLTSPWETRHWVKQENGQIELEF